MKYENNKIVYEAGDYCWSTCDDCVYKITELGKGKELSVSHANKYNGLRRPATQEEIDKAAEEEKIMWGQYEVNFAPKGNDFIREIITIGCVTVSKELYIKTGKKAGWINNRSIE